MVTALGDASPVATLVNISNTFDKWAITKIHRKPTLQLECIQTQEPCTWRHYHNFEWYAGRTVGQSQLLRSHFCPCKTSKGWGFHRDFPYGRIYAWMSREKSLNFAPLEMLHVLYDFTPFPQGYAPTDQEIQMKSRNESYIYIIY